jgi:predicted transcriptional regulator
MFNIKVKGKTRPVLYYCVQISFLKIGCGLRNESSQENQRKSGGILALALAPDFTSEDGAGINM